MLDFLRISTRPTKNGVIEIFPKFVVGKSHDLMIRGGDFFAIYNEDKHLWSTDEEDVIKYIDAELDAYADNYKKKTGVQFVNICWMWDSDSGMINKWHTYCQKQMRDNFKPLDQNILFANADVQKNDYSAHLLPYVLQPGSTENWDALTDVLYAPEQKHKIEWCIGAIVTGASKKIHKYLVLYGDKGTGKSTIMDIIKKIFDGYWRPFRARDMGNASMQFPFESIQDNPPIAIDDDTDLSKLNDNTTFNAVSSHAKVLVNCKNKSMFPCQFITFLIMGSNNPVLITDAKSGALRRMIDVNPTGNRIPVAKYNQLIKDINFELGAIAAHCKEVYESDPNYYDDYVPLAMMGETNDFYNFMQDNFLMFKRLNQVTLKEVWTMYKQYCDDAKVPTYCQYPMRLVKSELKTYFREFEEDHVDPNGKTHTKNVYTGFKFEMFERKPKDINASKAENNQEATPLIDLIEFKEQHSKLDDYCYDCPAQYATPAETPSKKWESVTTTLKDIDTKKLHYVRPQENHIVIDFDLKDAEGKKSFKLNLEAASKWPKTYAELSKSGSGVHLHYIYDGDVSKLSRIYDENIEVKVFTGNSSLRRKLSKCNDEDIRHISSGLPLREIKNMESMDIIKNEKQLRAMIIRCLHKEYNGYTAPEMNFIKKLTDDAYNSGIPYDISDLYNHVLKFANNSTNQKDNCMKIFAQIHWKSEVEEAPSVNIGNNRPIAFFDVEVFPNLFVICYKIMGSKEIMSLVNPGIDQINSLLTNFRLIGFNNRRYDNHILYAGLIGKTVEQIYEISQKIINDEKKGKTINTGHFTNAYNLSYTDIYDYCSNDNKMSLKKWEIKLGIHHLELGLPWDKPVPKELWEKVKIYCGNDVDATEKVFEATEADFVAREILAEIAGMTVNDTTNSLTTRIIFGNERKPLLVYSDLSKEFPGYEFVKTWNAEKQKYDKANMYRGIDVGFGGLAKGVPGMYFNIALLDIASMHPHSAIALNAFGEYTKKFEDLVNIRVLIKHGDFESAKKLFDGKLNKYLDDPSIAKKLSNALKTAINSVYGLSSAGFDNPFRHPDNENNIIALRGALFIKTLADEVTNRGYTVAHLKTDSIKIVNADIGIINFCKEFARKYKYEFEHEATYDRMCLMNDSVYIAKYASEEYCMQAYGYVPEKNHKEPEKWTATGAQFAVPYVFKKCFSHEEIVYDDLCEVKQVTSAIYLDFNEDIDMTQEEIDRKVLKIREDMRNKKDYKITKPAAELLAEYESKTDDELRADIEKYHRYQFVGKVGCFCPVKPGFGGARLVVQRNKPNGTVDMDSVSGCKKYRWLEAASVKDNYKEMVDLSYFNTLVDDAIADISKLGDYYAFVA